jgi:hypothetical protein
MDKTRKAQKLEDTKAELELVNKAITAILKGSQGYKIGSRSVQKADLALLYKRKDDLNNAIDDLEGRSGRIVRVVPTDY